MGKVRKENLEIILLVYLSLEEVKRGGKLWRKEKRNNTTNGRTNLRKLLTKRELRIRIDEGKGNEGKKGERSGVENKWEKK